MLRNVFGSQENPAMMTVLFMFTPYGDLRSDY